MKHGRQAHKSSTRGQKIIGPCRPRDRHTLRALGRPSLRIEQGYRLASTDFHCFRVLNLGRFSLQHAVGTRQVPPRADAVGWSRVRPLAPGVLCCGALQSRGDGGRHPRDLFYRPSALSSGRTAAIPAEPPRHGHLVLESRVHLHAGLEQRCPHLLQSDVFSPALCRFPRRP